MEKFNQLIFKAYDIRGIYQQDFDEGFAYQLGFAYAKWRKNELGIKDDKRRLSVVVGRDMRLSSSSLAAKLVEGLLAADTDVKDIGLVSTPTFYFGISDLKADGGIMVSASHNPAEWNGFKLTRDMAKPISGDGGLSEIRDLILKDAADPADNFPLGDLEPVVGILERHVEHDLKYVSLNNIKPMKIAADAANSMGAQYLEALFNKLPIEAIKLNFELDGSFPAHEADPIKEENMVDLERSVISEKADLGIATDGDGDRIFFVDNLGKTINQAIIRAILAKIFLQDKPGSVIGYDVRPGKITPDTIIASGGKPLPTRVGHSLIKEAMLKNNAYFGGESSGHFFLNMDCGCFEAPMVMVLKLLSEISASGLSVADYIKPYQKYYSSGEINRSVEDKEVVFKKLRADYNDGQQSELDGLTVEYPDFWFNVRASNTENKMRLNLEAVSQEIMQAKTEEVLKIISA